MSTGDVLGLTILGIHLLYIVLVIYYWIKRLKKEDSDD